MTHTVPIVMPQLGESIAEATVVRWLVKPGDIVTTGQEVMEVETSKATLTVTTPVGGKIKTLTAEEGATYAVGNVLGELTTDIAPAKPAADKPHFGGGGATITTTSSNTVEPVLTGLPVPVGAAGASYLSPRLKARMAELGLHAADLAGVAGSGANGRVTVEDFEAFVARLEQNRLTPASSMRIAVADAMRRSWTRPIATVGMPVRLDALLAHRASQNPKPGPALYALRALSLALSENSKPAGRLVGSRIVHPSSIDIGFAVEAEDGVLVPVIREADKKSLCELTGRYNELVSLARERRLPADATGGSIATITNFGTFGLTWATPIPLPEQTLVLGLGAGSKVPFWDEEKKQFIPVMEANLTLSFDHRVMDGGAAGRLLGRVAMLMTVPDAL
ncbi:MAG: pdhC 2 [Verrucomicrobia bacterium]|jgi:pyruvate/2-oxoglutarate dehydrogenase complex dihydrolipoamide acyltransferase (E2) component|nr:pdhC 2 [Verrucomicrobiota bacterium]